MFTWLKQPKSFWGSAFLALISGLLLATSFPGFNFALGVPLGLFFLLVSINNSGFFKSLILGFVSGFAFYGLVLIWLTTYLGPVPWLALCLAEALFFAVSVAMIAVVWNWMKNFKNNQLGFWLSALSIAIIYTGREYFAGHFPYGGLPWARLGLSQVENALAKWVWAVDISGLTLLLVFVSAVLTLKFLQPHPQGMGLAKRLRFWTPQFLVLAVFIVPAIAVPLPKGEVVGTLNVAAVQGNVNAGLFAVNPPGSILDKHLSVSRELISAGKTKDLDLMVWPENASDLDPINMLEPAMKISQFVTEELKAPLLFGTKTFRGPDFFNEVNLWLPETGLADWYDKKRPVPFGEYVPNRDFFMALAPDMIGLIGWDMSPGTRDGIFSIPNKTDVGSLICFEVTIDELSDELVDQGATAIMVQTNSSDFGKSVQGVQLAAISRMRAIETGRTVVSISTVGVSGIYSPDGTVIDELESFTPAGMVQTINLRSDKTPAVTFGRYVEPLSFGLAIGLFLIALVGSIVSRRRKA